MRYYVLRLVRSNFAVIAIMLWWGYHSNHAVRAAWALPPRKLFCTVIAKSINFSLSELLHRIVMHFH